METTPQIPAMGNLGRVATDLAQSSQHLSDTQRESSERLTAAAKYARILLGCYSKSDASDPDVFTAAVIAIFARFTEAVMREVSNPTSGLPVRLKWFPQLSEINTACIDEQRRQEALARYAAMRTEPRQINGAELANVFVPASVPMYPLIRERCTDDNRKFWRLDEGNRVGVWVPLDWVLQVSPQSRVYGEHDKTRELVTQGR